MANSGQQGLIYVVLLGSSALSPTSFCFGVQSLEPSLHQDVNTGSSDLIKALTAQVAWSTTNVRQLSRLQSVVHRVLQSPHRILLNYLVQWVVLTRMIIVLFVEQFADGVQKVGIRCNCINHCSLQRTIVNVNFHSYKIAWPVDAANYAERMISMLNVWCYWYIVVVQPLFVNIGNPFPVGPERQRGQGIISRMWIQNKTGGGNRHCKAMHSVERPKKL